MSLVSNGDDDGERNTSADIGGPPGNELPDFGDIAFDPLDPESVKVHYDVSAWSFDQRAELSEVLAEVNMPHSWDGDELVVPEEVEGVVDSIFEALENELGPFPVALDEAIPSVAYELDEWPASDIESLRTRLVTEQVPHRWETSTVVIDADAETTVDAILDEIEAGTATAPPANAISDLTWAARKLAKNPAHSKGRSQLLELAPSVADTAPPDGLEPSDWAPILTATSKLAAAFEADDVDTDEVSQLASQLAKAAEVWL